VVLVNDGSFLADVSNSTTEIPAVKESDASGYEIERGGAMRLPLVAAIPEPAELMKRYGSGQGMP
jgi:hypothetical protein